MRAERALKRRRMKRSVSELMKEANSRRLACSQVSVSDAGLLKFKKELELGESMVGMGVQE